jgi:hypothetical protein
LNVVLLVGSAPDALRVQEWDLHAFTSCVVINNAWQLTEEWDYLIFPEDLPHDRLPSEQTLVNKKLITALEFVPEQNRFGGFVYAGGTMAFTAGYWALGALKPDVIAYLGCDMIYSMQKGDQSHFYGQGQADPLRKDVTLQSLEAKSIRLMAMAQMNGCTVVNLSDLPDSRLKFPRVSLHALSLEQDALDFSSKFSAKLDANKVEQVLQCEQDLGYMVSSGRYWEHTQDLDAKKLSAIDSMWLESRCE